MNEAWQTTERALSIRSLAESIRVPPPGVKSNKVEVGTDELRGETGV